MCVKLTQKLVMFALSRRTQTALTTSLVVRCYTATLKGWQELSKRDLERKLIVYESLQLRDFDDRITFGRRRAPCKPH